MDDPHRLRLAGVAHRLQSAASSFVSLFPFPSFPNHGSKPHPNPNPNLNPSSHEPSTSSVLVPFPFCSNRSLSPFATPSSLSSSLAGLSTGVRIDGLGTGSSGGGPAFVGQVFSMCDPSGTGLMTVTSRFNLPFLSKRMPDWVKSMFKFNKPEDNCPVFHFFMDLSDAVSYVRRLNVPSSVVGACRLDVAYDRFKEKPHMFRFVPNAKQVKEANKLLKANGQKSGRKKLDGVPVFSAQNLNIAIATKSGIKWYTPYFFDKNLLDNILEASADQHFHTLIQTRHGQRWRDVLDDGVGSDTVEESLDSIFEPPEVQEVMDEMGPPEIPLSVLSKVAEIQLLDVVDRVMLGNRWLRKAAGIQPKFPYLVDTFEARTAASVINTKESTSTSFSESSDFSNHQPASQERALKESRKSDRALTKRNDDHVIPFWDRFPNPWGKSGGVREHGDNVEPPRFQPVNDEETWQECANPLLPKITMVGISAGGGGKVSKASLKKTMENLTRALEENDQRPTQSNDKKDPLFVANVGDYLSITRLSSVNI